MSRTAMMCLSQTTGYAIRALSCIEDSGGQPRFIRQIAKCSRIPGPYLAKIINQLAHQGIVSAKRGYRGGIVLGRPATEISLLEIVEALEGEQWIGTCLLGFEDCAARRVCPTHQVWQRIREEIREVLRSTTLADVIRATQDSKLQSAKSRKRRRPDGTRARRVTARPKSRAEFKPGGREFPAKVLLGPATAADLHRSEGPSQNDKPETPREAPVLPRSQAQKRAE